MTGHSNEAKGADVVRLTRGKCPICGQPSKAETRPFCSRRCANRDLGNWLNESYFVPGEELSDPEHAEGIERDDEA